jgi:hypothetical protein
LDSWYCARLVARRDRSSSRWRRRSRFRRLRSRCFAGSSRSSLDSRNARPASCDAIVMLETLTSMPAMRSAASSAIRMRRSAARGATYGFVSTVRCAS